MLKKAFILAGIFIFLFFSDVHSQELKIGYVDIFKLFNQYKKTQTYDKMLESKRSKKEKLLKEKKEEIKKMQEKLNLLNEEEQEKQRRKITRAAEEYRKMEREFYLDLKKERDEKMKEIVDDIRQVINNYGRKNGYQIILNKGAVLYGEEGLDLTDTILKIINQNYKE